MMYNALPFEFAVLKIQQQANHVAGDSRVVQALRHVLIREPVNTLQFDHQRIFDEDISKVSRGSLTRAYRDLKRGTEHTVRQTIEFHRRSSAFIGG